MQRLKKEHNSCVLLISRTLEEDEEGDTFSTLFSLVDIKISLPNVQNGVNALALSTNSTNYIKQFDIS